MIRSTLWTLGRPTMGGVSCPPLCTRRSGSFHQARDRKGERAALAEATGVYWLVAEKAWKSWFNREGKFDPAVLDPTGNSVSVLLVSCV